MKHFILFFIGTLFLATLTSSRTTNPIERNKITTATVVEKGSNYFLKSTLYRAYETTKTVCDWFKYKVAKAKLTDEQRKDYANVVTGLQVKMMSMSKFDQALDNGEYDKNDINANFKQIVALLPTSPELALFLGYSGSIEDITAQDYPGVSDPAVPHCQNLASAIYDDCMCAAFVKAKCNEAASINADSNLFDHFEAISCLVTAAGLEKECVRTQHPESPNETFPTPAANLCDAARSYCFEEEYPADGPQIPQHPIPEQY